MDTSPLDTSGYRGMIWYFPGEVSPSLKRPDGQRIRLAFNEAGSDCYDLRRR